MCLYLQTYPRTHERKQALHSSRPRAEDTETQCLNILGISQCERVGYECISFFILLVYSLKNEYLYLFLNSQLGILMWSFNTSNWSISGGVIYIFVEFLSSFHE
jgi:hypothetical protein